MLKIFRSPQADFEADAALADQVYTDEVLAGLADAGFNAIWVRTIFRQLLANGKYPSFGERSAQLLDSLKAVIQRGAKYGVGLVVYNQEPFGLSRDDPFWAEHPEMAGADFWHNHGSEAHPFRMRALCVSAEPVREYLVESAAAMLRELPGLAGVITITASEFVSHCYSNYLASGVHAGDAEPQPLRCPRCRERHPTDLVVDVLNCMRQGMDKVSPQTPLIAWNWSWSRYEPDPQESILSRLRPGIDLMAGFERGGVKMDPYGREILIDEYALSYPGPSERFLAMHRAAKALGLKVHTKLQFGTTHELATAPNLPLVGNLYDKARACADLGLAGYMGCWNFGNALSLNTRAFNYFLAGDGAETKQEALRALAASEFPGCDATLVLRAWERFVEAFDYYPFTVPFLYYSPVNYALSLPLVPGPMGAKPFGRSWLMDARDGNDDPARSYGCFTPEEIVERLQALVRVWTQGLAAYGSGLAGAGGEATRELGVARAIGLALHSALNYYRLHLLKREWRDEHLPRFRDIVREEAALLDEAIPLYQADPRLGYHSEAHDYMVTPEMMRCKREQLLGYL